MQRSQCKGERSSSWVTGYGNYLTKHKNIQSPELKIKTSLLAALNITCPLEMNGLKEAVQWRPYLAPRMFGNMWQPIFTLAGTSIACQSSPQASKIPLLFIIISTIGRIMQVLHSQRETRSLFSILLTTQYLSDLKWNGFTKNKT